MQEFKVPELGENVEQGDVTRVLVKVGDTIKQDQSVVELETDKATIEVPSSVAGTVKEIKVKQGDKVKVGAVILTVDENGAGAPAKPEQQPEPEPAPAQEQPRAAAAAPKPAEQAKAAAPEQKAGNGQPFEQMLALEPGVELGLASRAGIVPDRQDAGLRYHFPATTMISTL